MNKNSNNSNIDPDILEEIREILIDALDERRWINVEEALEILNEELGYDDQSVSDTAENGED